MEEKIEQLKQEAANAVKQAVASIGDLNDIRVKYLGKKGELTTILRGLGQLSKEDRPRIGQIVNEARQQLEQLIAEKNEELRSAELQKRLGSEKIDVTLAGRRPARGHLHPLTLTLMEIKDIFMRMGFSVEEGPEIEKDYYNFEALNLPKDHPARDMQDSFYITEDILMRSQTSPVQARTMENHEPNSPIRMIAPGRVYRRDDYDATHSPMFTQIEGMVIDKGISLADLKGTLETFLKQIFGEKVKVRLRPSFFPFTEPSAEVDISCVMCKGAGCRVCKGTGWLEILGAGMIHPNVLRMSGYDPEKVSGFAFGMGVERITMLRYGIDDLSLFYDNDLRFLKQF
ncbi:MAG: phenylalanine--tRNA ligase subunit alpha [Selenomonadaceae bacterium]|nr:phenylalanine--tRNA ligase subunit alpha [Selenomonadaceae bacterium]